MLIKIIILIFLSFILLLPLIFDKKLRSKKRVHLTDDDIRELERLERLEKMRNLRRQKWTGPKTDQRINRMLAESIALLKGIGCPISDSICPEVELTGSRSYFGICYDKRHLKKPKKYDFYIKISGYTLKNRERQLRNTLIHELIHTVPGGQCHTGEWKKWAKYVSKKTGYDIQRLSGDTTQADIDRLLGDSPGFI